MRTFERSSLLAACVLTASTVLGLAVAAPAEATTVTFEWVNRFPLTGGPSVTPSGSLTLTLPSSITTQTFDTGNLGSGLAALNMITAFSYRFSNNVLVDLSQVNLGLSSITTPTTPQTPNAWYTSNEVDPSTPYPPWDAPLGIYLLTGFILAGTSPAGGTFQIANSAGLQGPPSNVQPAANTLTPLSGFGSNDSGYWHMTSFQATVVPVPAALPLLLSGLLGFGALRLRRSRAA